MLLEKLYPENSKQLKEHRLALSGGFSLHYDWLANELSEELSKDECKSVLDVLDMYRAINTGMRNIPQDDDLHTHDLIKFPGYDANNEAKKHSYVNYYIVDLGRYEELLDDETKLDRFNSHREMSAIYLRMVERWKCCKDRFSLDRNDIFRIIEVGT
jgi:uncharacterized protein